MNQTTTKNPSGTLAAGGAAFLALATYFLGRDLSLPPETVLAGSALLVSILAAIGRPRRWPVAAPAALLGLALAGGGWFLAVASPALFPALVITAVGSIVAAALAERRVPASATTIPGQLAWYAAGT